MARRSAAPQAAAEPLVEESNDVSAVTDETVVTDGLSDAEAAEVSEEIGEQAAEVAAENAEATEEAKEEEIVDLVEFEAASAEYVATENDADATGVKEIYSGLTRKGKVAATKHLQAMQEAALENDDWSTAKGYLTLGKEIKAAPVKAPKTPKVAKNPTEGFIARVATLQLAYALAIGTVPAGTDENWQDQVAALASDPNELVKSAADKLAKSKLGVAKKEKDGPTRARHDVAKHIAEAFAAHPAGTEMDVQTIRSFDSSEYGEGNRPGAAAINAHIKNEKFAIEGLEVMRNDKGVPSGVRKVVVEVAE